MLKWTHQLEIQVFSHFYSCTFSIEQFQTLLSDLTMPILGLTWDPAFLRTRAGMTLALESGVGLLGALVGFVLANGFESFLMWGAFFASGFFLFTHVTNLTQSLESRFPYLVKIVSLNVTLKNHLPITAFTPQHLAYMAAWSVGLAIMCVYRLIPGFWSLMSVRDKKFSLKSTFTISLWYDMFWLKNVSPFNLLPFSFRYLIGFFCLHFW